MKTPCLWITGACGYIGSHVTKALIEDTLFHDFDFIILDDLSTGHREFFDVLCGHAKRVGRKAPKLIQANLLESTKYQSEMMMNPPEAVLHFAAKISVEESVHRPDFYFENNLKGSEILLQVMKKAGVHRIVFSSTAAVYGEKEEGHALIETDPLSPKNPYAESKLQMEQAIQKAHHDWGLNAIIFRYFNAAGASRDGSLGEWHEPETHLIPRLIQAASKSDFELKLYGFDYATRDGTCVRDYIHVEDLAMAHVLGLKKLMSNSSYLKIMNLGTESGATVMEVHQELEVLLGKKIAYQKGDRRAGDLPYLVASFTEARSELNWEPRCSSLKMILKTAYDWETNRKKF